VGSGAGRLGQPALRRDMGWVMAVVYWIVQFAAAACGSLLARA
jgi:aquaporin Z